MITMQKIKNFLKQFMKFGIVGVINTVSSWIFYYTLLFFSVHYIIATTIAYVLSSIIGFILNKTWVFKSKNKVSSSLIKYIITYGSSYLLNIGLMYTFVDILKISDKIAPILVLFFTIPYNYVFSKIWVFKNKNKDIKEFKNHTFTICAYKESEYLEECIKSLKNQTVKSNIIICTSTPNKFIEKLAKKYKLKLFIKDGKSDIQDDWNFAVSNCKTDLVTVAHQDDIYHEDYLKNVLNGYTGKELMLFTEQFYYKNGEAVKDKNTSIKRFLKLPLRTPFRNIRWIRKLTLAFGNTINCPSVTYNVKLLGTPIFTSDLKFGLDWDTFRKIYSKKGKIYYTSKRSIYYRVHDEATSKAFIVNNKRYEEDVIMFRKFWPNWIVKIIMKYYVKCYDVYN
jgi:putative flippase GtrA